MIGTKATGMAMQKFMGICTVRRAISIGSFLRANLNYSREKRSSMKERVNGTRSFFSGTALVCLGVMSGAGAANAFDSGILSSDHAAPTTSNCLEAMVGRSINSRIQHNVYNGQLVGGGYWAANADIINSSPSLSTSSLAQCGYTDPVIVSQVGPTGATYAADDYIGVIWRAGEGTSTDVYEYEFAVVGATGTHIVDTRTLIGTRPTVSVGANVSSVAAGQTATVSFTLDQSVTIANAGAIAATGGTLSALSGSGQSYSATFTPSANTTGSAQITVGNGAFEGATGFTNQDVADSDNTVSISVDTMRPTVSIAAFTGPLNGEQSAVITLSEASTDFVVGDLTLTNATATLSGSGRSYTAVLTPIADGPVALSVGAGTFRDAAGNTNAVGSNEVTTTYDGTAPTVSIAAFTGPLNGDQSAVITLSEASTDFVVGDMTLTNATATLSGSGTSYAAVLTPIADGPVALSIGVGTFSDAAGNTNTVASNEVTMSYDGTAPVIRPIGNLSLEAGPDGTRLIGFSTIVDDNVDSGIVPVFSLNGDVITSPYAFPLGANVIKINATDSAGNPAIESQFTLNITPGAGPDAPILTITTINANRSMTISGTTEVDATVRIRFPDANVETVTATGGTFSVTSSADMVGGTISVTAEDSLGNVSPAATVDLFPDYDAPTISIAAFTGPLNGDQTALITLSEDSTDFVLADLTLTNATATLSGSGTSYTAVLTPVADGQVALSVGVGTFSDAAGNTNAAASNEVTATYDGTAPTVSIAAFTGALNGDQTAVITLSEDSTDFVLADLTLTNATATLSGSGTSYTAVLTPIADGPVALSVGAGTFRDAAGNTNAAASNEVTTTYDGIAPTVSIAAFTGPLNGDQSAVITLSEASTDFVVGDLTLTNATAALSGSGTSYTAVLTPIADGPVALSVGAGTFRDAAGNTNAAASNEVTTTHDGTAPAVSIAAFTGPLNGDQSAVITLSEASTDFVVGDLTLTNATATLSGSGTSYTALLTPIADGPVALSVGAGTFSDAAGNTNAAASNEVTTTYDGTTPTVSIAALTGPLNGEQTALITLSEASTDFEVGDLTLTNATATLSGSGTSYTAVLTPVADGPVALSVGAGTFSDAAGNTNAVGSNEVTTTYDGTAPTVNIAASVTSVVGPTPIDVVVTFSEVVTGFDASDLVLANASVTSVSGGGADYLVTIAGTGGGNIEAVIPAMAAFDAAGNANVVSNTLMVSSAVVEETQKRIAQFMQSRANQLVSSQPSLTEFLSGGQSGGFVVSATQAGGNFNFATPPESDNGLWIRLNGSWTREDRRESEYVFGALGSHYTFSPELLVGGMVEFDYLSQGDGVAKAQGQGWLAGLYVVARAPNQPLFLDGRILYGQTANDVSPLGTYTDRFDTERLLAQAKISGELTYSATTLIPSLQVSYTTDDQDAYTDSLNNLIPAQGVELAQAEIAVDFRHDVALKDGNTSLELTGGIAATGSSTSGAGNADLIVPEYEGGRAKVKMGANYTMANGATLGMGTFYDGIGTKNYESFGLQVGFNFEF